jgi:valyl-tRNA synthetase
MSRQKYFFLSARRIWFSDIQPSLAALRLGAEAAGNYAKEHPAAANQAATTDAGKLKEQLQSDVDVFSQVTTSSLLPLGWKHPRHFYEDYFRVAPKDAIFSALTILAGWVMTALAISFGAPFWFDTLNRLWWCGVR